MKENIIVNLNEIFNNFFLKKITFILDNKNIKQGRLKLFTMKGFNLKFFLVDNGGETKTFEIPYPFEINKTTFGYVFDYRIEKFKLLKKTELLDNLEEKNIPKSRFYNKPLVIKIE